LSCTCRTPNHLKTNEKNIETHFAYEDGDSDYGHVDATHLDIIIFFAKPNGSIDLSLYTLNYLIDHVIAKCVGTICFSDHIMIYHVLFVLEFTLNIVSIQKLTNTLDCQIVFSRDPCLI